MGSIHRHLETAHTLRLEKYWECGVYGFAGDGPTLKGHYQSLHFNHNPSPSIRLARISSMDGSNRDSSAAVISLEEVAVTEYERDELSVMEIPAIEETPSNVLSPANFTASPILDIGREFASSFNKQNFSWLSELPPQENTSPTILSQEILDPSPNPETLVLSPVSKPIEDVVTTVQKSRVKETTILSVPGFDRSSKKRTRRGRFIGSSTFT
ncbi:Uncharacterized protein APZ42_006318 [Daphnia magna]|uniref:Uncharacterized protein n=1 Tax=Daphnia magna TaxID=35525 RepID=A0A164FZ02_9CRUS|nr:Uncharacterized protein APZ42_006318 [Daphnia magna]